MPLPHVAAHPPLPPSSQQSLAQDAWVSPISHIPLPQLGVPFEPLFEPAGGGCGLRVIVGRDGQVNGSAHVQQPSWMAGMRWPEQVGAGCAQRSFVPSLQVRGKPSGAQVCRSAHVQQPSAIAGMVVAGQYGGNHAHVRGEPSSQAPAGSSFGSAPMSDEASTVSAVGASARCDVNARAASSARPGVRENVLAPFAVLFAASRMFAARFGAMPLVAPSFVAPGRLLDAPPFVASRRRRAPLLAAPFDMPFVAVSACAGSFVFGRSTSCLTIFVGRGMLMTSATSAVIAMVASAMRRRLRDMPRAIAASRSSIDGYRCSGSSARPRSSTRESQLGAASPSASRSATQNAY